MTMIILLSLNDNDDDDDNNVRRVCLAGRLLKWLQPLVAYSSSSSCCDCDLGHCNDDDCDYQNNCK